MKKNALQIGLRGFAFAALALTGLLVPSILHAAGATAMASARVLGPADTETATGAVTVSKLSDNAVEVSRSGRTGAFSSFRIAGGFNASYAVTLPEAVTVKSGAGQVTVSGFRVTGTTGRLASDGTAVIGIDATVTVPAGQTAGRYEGSYTVTIAYN